MSKQTTYERATLEYDVEHERALIEAIATAIFEVSRVTDVNAAVIRTGEAARALTKSLAMVLALSPAAARSPTALRKTSDEIGKCLRRYVVENERDGIAQEFLRRPARLRSRRLPATGRSAA
jgi:hypothetical protein